MRPSCRLTVVMLSMAVVLLLVAAWPGSAPRPQIDRAWQVQVVAHRGGLIERPDSTLAAYDHAVAVGADWLELDIHLSADGVPVIIHDETVDRTTNGQGRVAEMTLARLQRLDAAYRWPEDIPKTERPFASTDTRNDWRGSGLTVLTLDEFLDRYRTQRLMIEIKPPGETAVEAVLAVLKQHGRKPSVIIASFHQDTIDAVRSRSPEIATVASPAEARRFVLLANLGLARFWPRTADALALPPTMGQRTLLNARVVDAARRHGVPLHVWTINDPEQWDQLIELGVDGILTDRPEALMAHLRSRRLAPIDRNDR